MAFLEIPYLELLVELPEEQQETIAGGESNSYVTEHRYTNEYEYTDHSKEISGESNDTEESETPFDKDGFMVLLPLGSLKFPQRLRL